MAKFRYRMQNILDIKLKLEEQAKIEFSLAAKQLAQEEEILRNYQIQRAGYERELAEATSGRLDFNSIRFCRSAINTMKTKIRSQMMQVHTAQRNLETKRRILNEVRAERKTHENLKEKAFEQFKKDIEKEESKAIDELVSYTFGEEKRETDNAG